MSNAAYALAVLCANAKAASFGNEGSFRVGALAAGNAAVVYAAYTYMYM